MEQSAKGTPLADCCLIVPLLGFDVNNRKTKGHKCYLSAKYLAIICAYLPNY